MCFFASRGRCTLRNSNPRSAAVLSHSLPFLPPFNNNSCVSITSSPFAFLLLWHDWHFVSSIGFTMCSNTMASSGDTTDFLFSGNIGANKKFCPCDACTLVTREADKANGNKGCQKRKYFSCL